MEGRSICIKVSGEIIQQIRRCRSPNLADGQWHGSAWPKANRDLKAELNFVLIYQHL